MLGEMVRFATVRCFIGGLLQFQLETETIIPLYILLMHLLEHMRYIQQRRRVLLWTWSVQYWYEFPPIQNPSMTQTQTKCTAWITVDHQPPTQTTPPHRVLLGPPTLLAMSAPCRVLPKRVYHRPTGLTGWHRSTNFMPASILQPRAHLCSSVIWKLIN